MSDTKVELITLDPELVRRIKIELVRGLRKDRCIASGSELKPPQHEHDGGHGHDHDHDHDHGQEHEPRERPVIDGEKVSDFEWGVLDAVINVSAPLPGNQMVFGIDVADGWANGPDASPELRKEFREIVEERGLKPRTLIAAAYSIGEGSHWIQTYIHGRTIWIKGSHSVWT